MNLQSSSSRNVLVKYYDGRCDFGGYCIQLERAPLIFALALVTLTAAGCRRHIEPIPHGRSAEADTSIAKVSAFFIGKSGLPTIEMSESEFEDWLEKRKQLAEILPMLSAERRISQLPQYKDKPCLAFMAISLPEREELIMAREAHINLAEPGWKEFLEGIHYYPEIARILFMWPKEGNPQYEPQEYEEKQIPLEVMAAMHRLPLLASFACQGGIYSKEAIKLLAAHPSIRAVGLGRCQIAPDDFSQMENLKILERLSVTTGASPEWFITLAKLPQFRKFSISGKTLGEVDLNQPIDDETRRAIESLNGRLEEFCAYETYGLEVHPDIARALLQVKSLKKLNVYVGRGLVVEDLKELLNMPNLIDQGFFTTPDNWGDDDKAASEMINQGRIMAEKRWLAARSSNEP